MAWNRKCRRCGSDGPFPPKRRICQKCLSADSVAWQKAHPDKLMAKVKRWNERHPEEVPQIAHRNYEKRKASGKIDAWKQENREHVNFIARVGYWKRRFMDKKLQEIAREAIDQAKSEGLDDDDAKWMAVGAVNCKAREAGVVGEELSSEMNAASQAIVKQEMKKHGR